MKKNSSNIFCKFFTLLEVITAIAILSLGLAGLFQLSISGQLKVAQAVEKYNASHRLTQAAEYILLQKDEVTEIPEEFFPWLDEYQLDISWEDVEDLPEDFQDQVGQLPLRSCTIELVNRKNSKVEAKIILERLGYDSKEETTQGGAR
jgi:prepilin-type N-terminal cleavage/methylation domain-containing protein